MFCVQPYRNLYSKEMKKLLYILLVMVALGGCKTKQSISEKVFIKESDSLILKTTAVESPPILSSLVINEICDTVTAKPKDFKQVFVVSGDTMELSIKNNELKLSVNRLKRDLEKTKEELSKKGTKLSSVTVDEKVRNVIPFEFWIALVVSILYGIGMTYLWIRK